MEINIVATVGICTEYISAPDIEKAEVSVVIAPIKVTSEDESKLRVVTGCNLWQSCHNTSCWYSIAAREKKKARPGK
ncbi:unnamed protein product [marine sediment metagenome]|uniref:Uncharacterized protein n=1 Tax=marine sediment metagenome TaxID=412755 RepID=X1PXY1_9ZZZZ